jgi:hypothetical protein
MFSIADVRSRGAGARTAAAKLNVELTSESPLYSTGGWLKLPWIRILVGGGLSANELDPTLPATEPDRRPEFRSEFRHFFVAAFIRNVVFWTWWVGAVIGGIVLWRRGGAADLPWGIVAGGVAGIGFSATVACCLLLGDLLPQMLYFPDGGNFALLFFVWLPLVLICWALWGAGLGLLCAFVPMLRPILLVPAQQALAWLCRLCGLRGLSAYFAPA